ncbi:MAG: hypothetical protein SWC96_13795 [Thermodesulfobacteriota bacterium]|nr:hypothetical protein [Thermodesulfobacteriota bacterium]
MWPGPHLFSAGLDVALFIAPFPKLSSGKLLVVASVGDRLCPFGHVQSLCEKWRISDYHFLSGGHWLVFNSRERGKAWYEFLFRMKFLDNPG